jgi:hypothetical protein
VFDERDAPVIGHRDQGRGLRPPLANVAPLRHARHDHRGIADMCGTAVDVAQCPIAKAAALKGGERDGGIQVMALRAVQAGVHHPDVESIRLRRLEAGQQTVRCVPVAEAYAVHRDGWTASEARRQMQIRAMPEDGDGGAVERQFPSDTRFSVVVAADDVDCDAGRMQPAQLRHQKLRGLHRGLVPVVQVARDELRIDPLLKAQINHGYESLTGGIAHQLRQSRITQGQRA